MSKVKVYWIDENGDRKDVDIGGEGYVLPTASKTTKGGIKVGSGLEMSGATLNCTVEGDSFFHHPSFTVEGVDEEFHSVPIENDVPYQESEWTGDAFSSVENAFELVFKRPAQIGDIIKWTHTSAHGDGFAYRAADKWINLDEDNVQTDIRWQNLSPLLSYRDRIKLNGLENYTLPAATATKLGGIKIGSQLVMNGTTLENFTLGTTPQTVEGGMWIAGGAS